MASKNDENIHKFSISYKPVEVQETQLFSAAAVPAVTPVPREDPSKTKAFFLEQELSL